MNLIARIEFETSTMPSNNGNSQSGSRNDGNNDNKENAGSHQKKGKKVSTKGFQGSASTTSTLYQKVITATGNQNTQFVALKYALAIYAGTTAKVPMWSESIRKMEQVDNKEFHLPYPDRKEFGKYNEAGEFTFNNIEAQDQFKCERIHFQERVKEGYKQQNEYERAGKEIYVALQGQIEQVVWDALAIDEQFEDARLK